MHQEMKAAMANVGYSDGSMIDKFYRRSIPNFVKIRANLFHVGGQTGKVKLILYEDM
jgi:hypothetical protein